MGLDPTTGAILDEWGGPSEQGAAFRRNRLINMIRGGINPAAGPAGALPAVPGAAEAGATGAGGVYAPLEEPGRPTLRRPGDVEGGGGPGGPPVGPMSPEDAHLAALVRQQRALEAPAPAMTGRQRLLRMIATAAPVALGGIFGGAAGATGAAQGVERGLEREHTERLAERIRREGEARTLGGQIEQERRAQEQRQYGERIEREKGEASERRLQERIDAERAAREEAERAAGERQERGFEESEKRQRAGFAEQERLAREREGTKAKGEITKIFAPAQDADVRADIMRKASVRAKTGDQQAMLMLTNQHVMMTLGIPRGRVGRVNQLQFEDAQRSAPLLQRVGARFDSRGYLSGVTLSPEQIDQMVRNSEDVRQTEWKNARNRAYYADPNYVEPRSILGGTETEKQGAKGNLGPATRPDGSTYPEGHTGKTRDGRPVVVQGGAWVLAPAAR